ncbi:MAG TPA: tetratricopeptide repeat protein [Frankiaceae bacterium]|nr:tetratricopeptide repeat protein [Frankiaceae bacterium]
MSDERQALARAEQLVELKRYDQAVITLRPALLDPDTSDHAFCLLAQCHLALGDPAAAEQAARQAVASGAIGEWPHRLIAISLLRRRKQWPALEAAREAVRQAPEDEAALQILTLVTLSGRQRAEAMSLAQRNVQLNPQSSLAHYTLGHVQAVLNHPVDGEIAYRNALRLDPNNADAALGLAKLLRHLRRDDEASQLYLNAAAQDPTNHRVRSELARLGLPVAGGLGIAGKLGGFFLLRALLAGVQSVVVVAAVWFSVLGTLAVVTTVMRVRGGRSLPAHVRAGLRSDYRNAALAWVCAAGLGSLVLGVAGLFGATDHDGFVLLGVGALLVAVWWRFRIGPRPSLKKWLPNRPQLRPMREMLRRAR